MNLVVDLRLNLMQVTSNNSWFLINSGLLMISPYSYFAIIKSLRLKYKVLLQFVETLTQLSL